MSQPDLHALLNLTAALLLTFGWLAIKGRGPWAAGGRRPTTHRNLMLSAFAVSTVFLVSYVDYHLKVGSVRFWGQGALRVIYLAILLPHTVLAAAMVPLILVTLVFALRGRLESHRRWARFTLPIWIFVSVTGVVVWFMLYALKPD